MLTPAQAEQAIAYLVLMEGARTYHVAANLGVATASARDLLIRMERQGRVKRCERYSYVNDTYWLPVQGAAPTLGEKTDG